MTVRPAALAGRGERLLAAIEAIDAANAGDPVQVALDGRTLGKEQRDAELACGWVLRLDPGATDEQLLAARAHHLQRWALPRADYPEGRAGYLRWRAEQKRRHAALVGPILREAGYGEASVARVAAIIRKENLRDDPAVQVHEDALCLVFLGTQFDPVSRQLGDDKTVAVLVKTLAKMSPAGLALVPELHLRGRLSELVTRAAAS